MSERSARTKEAFERSLNEAGGERYVLHLFVTGMTTQSTAAMSNIKDICDEKLRGRFDLEIVDIYQHPARAKDEQIIAAPTLVKKMPLPLRRLVGNLSDKERVLAGLGLPRSQ